MATVAAKQNLSLRIPHPVNLLLGIHFILLIAFDYLDQEIRLPLAGALVVGYFWVSLHAVFVRRDFLATLLIGLSGAIVLAWLVGFLFIPDAPTRHHVSFSTGLRYMSPFLAGIAIISARTRISLTMLGAFGCAIIASAVTSAILNDYQFLGGTARWHPFSSGLHTSAYAIALVAILALELQKRGALRQYAAIVTMATCLVILFGYGVRTAIIFVSVYFLVDWAASLARRRLVGAVSAGLIVPAALMVLTAFLALIVFSYDFETLSTTSSGRLSNYIERFEILANRGFGDLLVGHGPGSDLRATLTWRWGEKGSHSDFLRILSEGGLISLLAVLTYLLLLLRVSPSVMFAPILALAASSLLSNALLARPNVAFLFFCIIALKMQREISGKSKQFL